MAVIIVQIFASESEVSHTHFNALAGGDSLPISPQMIYRQKLDSLAYILAAESSGVSSTTFT